MHESRTRPARRPRRPATRRRRFAIGALAAVAAVPATATATISDAVAHPDRTTTMRVEPSTTGDGITTETDVDRHHLVVQPRDRRGDHLVVMLPGSNVGTAGYTDFTTHAARLGHAAIGLSYPNLGTIGAACQATEAAERCFEQARGEIVFGADVPDPQGVRYSSDRVDVDAANSISGRLIALIDHLAVRDRRWNRFLVDDRRSPYVAAHRGRVRLDHDRLILAGHSQGGGHAAFWAMRARVGRVVMLSSPDDTDLSGTASWIVARSATPLDRYWGLRHEAEGPYGENVAQVWSELGGRGVGAGDNTREVEVGDGSGSPGGSHRLVLPGDLGTPLANHMATAYDGAYLAGVPAAWTYLLRGGRRSERCW